MTTENGIELFDARGRMRPVNDLAADVAKLGPDAVLRFETLRLAAEAVEAAETAEKAATDHVKACVIALNEARESLARVRPKRSFLAEWRETLKGA